MYCTPVLYFTANRMVKCSMWVPLLTNIDAPCIMPKIAPVNEHFDHKPPSSDDIISERFLSTLPFNLEAFWLMATYVHFVWLEKLKQNRMIMIKLFKIEILGQSSFWEPFTWIYNNINVFSIKEFSKYKTTADIDLVSGTMYACWFFKLLFWKQIKVQIK